MALAMSEAERDELRRRAPSACARDYCWDAVADGLREAVPVDNEMMPPPYRSYVLVSLDRIARNYRQCARGRGSGRGSDGGREGRRLRARRAGGFAHAGPRGRQMAGRQFGGGRRGAALRRDRGAHPGDGRISAAGAGGAGRVRSHAHRAFARRHRGTRSHGASAPGSRWPFI